MYHYCTNVKCLQKNNLIKKYSFKINFNPGGGHLTWTFCPKTCRFCLSVLLLCYTTFDFLFGSFEQKREKTVWKVARCLGFLCQDWKMLEILDHQTVLEQNLENHLITKAVFFVNFLYSKYNNKLFNIYFSNFLIWDFICSICF